MLSTIAFFFKNCCDGLKRAEGIHFICSFLLEIETPTTLEQTTTRTTTTTTVMMGSTSSSISRTTTVMMKSTVNTNTSLWLNTTATEGPANGGVVTVADNGLQQADYVAIGVGVTSGI